MDFTQFINNFITLLVICNPLSALPAVLKITQNQSIADKKRTGLTTAFAVLIILLFSTWAGKPFLMILGIKLAAFQFAGGFILFLMSLSMLSAEESPIKQTQEEQKDKKKIANAGAIVPLAIPIIAGPGAISTLIVSVSDFPGLINQLLLSLSALLVSLVMGFILYFASQLEKVFGQSGINIVNRIGGLILAAIAIQTMAHGLGSLFPILMKAS